MYICGKKKSLENPRSEKFENYSKVTGMGFEIEKGVLRVKQRRWLTKTDWIDMQDR